MGNKGEGKTGFKDMQWLTRQNHCISMQTRNKLCTPGRYVCNQYFPIICPAHLALSTGIRNKYHAMQTIAFVEYIYYHSYYYIPIIELLIDQVTSNSVTLILLYSYPAARWNIPYSYVFWGSSSSPAHSIFPRWYDAWYFSNPHSATPLSCIVTLAFARAALSHW